MDAFKAMTPLYGLWSILEGGEIFIPRVHGGNTWCMLENVLKIECCKTEATEIKKFRIFGDPQRSKLIRLFFFDNIVINKMILSLCNWPLLLF
jgi:hypothetical protein